MSHHTRPPGPPPYTAAQIASLSTPTEKFIAQAELNSYIVGHRLADMRENGLRSSYPTSPQMDEATDPANARAFGEDIYPSRSSDHDESSTDGQEAFYSPNTSGSVRNNSWRGSTRGLGAGRGYGGHHPYLSQHARARITKRSKAKFPVEFFQNRHYFSDTLGSGNNHQRKQNHGRTLSTTALCPAFTSTGKCARLRCPDMHDTNKLALCKRWLYKDECTKGTLCHLSHLPTSHNTPHCLYFLEHRCTKSPCSFAHLRVDPTALVCDAFGRLGYCEMGEMCTELHVYECPEFANEGTCSAGDECTLRHVHHASRMKAAARHSPDIGTLQSNLDVDELRDIKNNSASPENLHAITQQHDYVPFDVDD